jgi:hypothetical protein
MKMTRKRLTPSAVSESPTHAFTMKRNRLLFALTAAALAVSAVTVSAANLLAPGQPIVGVAATPGSSSSAIATAGTAAGQNNHPAGEPPTAAIDASTGTKYLNFAEINAGFIVTLPNSSAVVTGIVFTAANDAPERDPLTVTIEGTSATDPTTAAAGATWTLLYNGPSGMAADPGRFTAGASMAFAGGAAFNTFRVLVTDVRNQATANSFQFSEVQLIGTLGADTNAPVITSVSPVAGTVGGLSNITVNFSEGVVGVTAGDLLINGTPAASVSGSGASYTFSFPQPALGNVTVSFVANHEITDSAATPNAFNETAPNATWNYNLVDNTAPTLIFRAPTPNTTVEVLNSIQVNFSEDVTGVDAADLLINGVAATNLVNVSPSIYTFEFAAPATGAVTVAFAPAHGITDTAVTPNAFAGATWDYVYNPGFQFTAFVITEFLTSNSGDTPNVLRDEDLDTSDWIEIYNPDTTIADIGGWYLTDQANNLTKWRFPNGTTVPARGYLVVFASGKNRTNVTSRLHTNFQLNNSGEYLGLINPKTNVVSEYFPTYPSQSSDISYGRDRNNQSVVGYYSVPTPGAHNTVAGEGFGPEVKFSREGGTFVGSFPLTLSVDEPGVQIRFTIVTNAQDVVTATNVPTQSSLLYTGAIAVTHSMQVRARAFPTNPAVFPGPPRSELFVQVSGGITNFDSSLPIVVIHTLATVGLSGGYPTPDNSVIVQAYDNTNANGRARLLGKPQLSKRAGINLRGSSTQGFPKGSFAVELWDEFNSDEEASFLGLPKESDWVLYAPNGFDKSLMHNPLLHYWGRAFGRYSSRTRFVELFFKNGVGAITGNTNTTGAAMGDYWGVYVLEEKVKRDQNRVDIDELLPQQTNAPAITGGYLLKIDRADGNERTFSPNGANAAVVYQDPDGLEMVTPARAAQATYILNYLNQFNTTLSGTQLTNGTGTNHYSHYLNIDESIDIHIANVLTLNVDGYRLSGYMYKPRNGKLVLGPLWDCDRGQGTSDQGTSQNGDLRAFNPRAWQAWDPLGASDYGTDFFQGTTAPGWLARLFADPEFWQRWIDRYQDLRTTVLATNQIGAVIDGMAAELREAQVREVKRWGGNGSSDTSPRARTVNAGGGVYSHTFNGTYQGEVDFQKRWYFDRIHFMDTNLLNRPRLSVSGGQVASGTMVSLQDVTGKAGTSIYYTLDGSDPRGRLGTTNPAAILYTGPITITNNVRIRARAVNSNHRNLTGISGPGSRNPVISSPWSGDLATTFYVEVPPLIVTELMYNPPAAASGTNDVDDFEYIELRNIGSNALNLVGFRFTNGIDFTFGLTNGTAPVIQPGGYVLVVKNRAAFESRYGASGSVVGEFGGNLANGGERITLVGPALEPVLDFTYSDEWENLTDGQGFSLVVSDESATSNLSTNTSWRRSAYDGGSPGASSPPLVVVTDQIIITEVLTHTDLPTVDAIELFNAGTNAANIGGWWLSDDFSEPKKYMIPDGTVLQPGAFLVVEETQFNDGPNGFALSSDGDEVWVFSGTNGFITGYYQGFGFGAAQNGRTFGRYVNSQGDVHYVAQAANTLGASNGLPEVGPIVISEIMYHPPELSAGGTNLVDNTLDEYIELRNISETNVALYHSQFSSNTWRLSSGVDFTFPAGVVIPPGGFAIVVSFDPAVAGAAFRAKYGVPESVPLFGPYSGRLDNSGESVRLGRPDAPNGRDVPYILVDRVDYQDTNAWPVAADGFGGTLNRLVASAYGNDPTNWVVARPTPGIALEGGAAPTVTQQPQDATVVELLSTNLSVAVSSTTPVTYQWRLNGNVVPGAMGPVLQVNNAQLDQAGAYSVWAFNGGGFTVSSNATLVVRAVAAILAQPVSTNVPPGSNFSLTVSAAGSGALRYQWRFNEMNIAGATNSILVVSNADLFAHAGVYDVLITDDVGVRPSAPATVVVTVRPFITQQLTPVTVVQGRSVRLRLQAGPDHPLLPLTFRWLRAGSPFATSSVPELLVTNVQATASYRAQVVNLAGNINSTSVTVTVLPDSDGDGVPDAFEGNNGMQPNDPNDGQLDPDGDGAVNLHEFLAGTSPTNSASVFRLNSIPAGGTNTAFQFTAVSNRTYQVDYRGTLGTNDWLNLLTIDAATTNRTIQLTNPASEPARFFRVTIPSNE